MVRYNSETKQENKNIHNYLIEERSLTNGFFG